MPPSNTLLALHGFSQNAEVLQESLSALERELGADIKIVCLNAPHVCSEDSVERLYRALPGKRLPGPHLCWWDASDDGLTYAGLDESLAIVDEALLHYEPAALLGFSQGAIFAATVAGLAQRAEARMPSKVVLIAGRVPRAARVQHAFAEPIAMPSLHIWGERDPLVADFGQALADRFAVEQRRISVWPGGHRIPQGGPAFEELVQFLRE